MSIPAWLLDDATTKQKPRDVRWQVSLEATGMSGAGEVVPISIHNISATGMLLETGHAMPIDQLLGVDLPQAPDTQAAVVWTSGHFHGCKFLVPLGKATLSAAQLRGAVDAAGGPSFLVAAKSGEPLELRLRRLRKARGLTLDELALKLGVSKPTVWAWEQARSAPSPERYEKIAEALGTSAAELRTGRQEDLAEAVLERSRRGIAEAFGVRAESVRIMIEL